MIRAVNLALAITAIILIGLHYYESTIFDPINAAPSPDNQATVIQVKSEILSAFWNQPVMLSAMAVVPENYQKTTKRYPGVYHFGAFGEGAGVSYKWSRFLRMYMAEHPETESIHLFLESNYWNGPHGFFDSDCNGPWGRALVEELIPALERELRLDPRTRFLTGHSTGGWDSVWHQITYPDVFQGAWSTSPDPLDFRNYFGADITPDSKDSNIYFDATGKARLYARGGPSIRERIESSDWNNECEAEYRVDERKWGPCGPDRHPTPLFNRQTGNVDPAVAAAWERYDVRRVLETTWDTLWPKIRGKLHIFVGDQDTFFLNEPTKLFCDFVAAHDPIETCVFVPGKNHLDLYRPDPLYPDGLVARMLKEMSAEAARITGSSR